jgi:hypothetical protein
MGASGPGRVAGGGVRPGSHRSAIAPRPGPRPGGRCRWRSGTRAGTRRPATRPRARCARRAAVARTASPTAAPVCWLVVNSAAARPWSRLSTPLVTAMDAVGPHEARRWGATLMMLKSSWSTNWAAQTRVMTSAPAPAPPVSDAARRGPRGLGRDYGLRFAGVACPAGRHRYATPGVSCIVQHQRLPRGYGGRSRGHMKLRVCRADSSAASPSGKPIEARRRRRPSSMIC